MKFLCAADAASEACCLCSRQTARQLARVSKRADEDWQGMWEALKKKAKTARASVGCCVTRQAPLFIAEIMLCVDKLSGAALWGLLFQPEHTCIQYIVSQASRLRMCSHRVRLQGSGYTKAIIDSCHTLIHRGLLNPAAQKEQPQHDEHMCVCVCVREIEGYSASC